MNKFYLINKPAGITSFKVISELKRKLSEKRIGHNGTLDPFATGVLFIAVGNYTKLLNYINEEDKEYKFEIMLDGVSDSYDIDTPINYIDSEKRKYAKETLTIDFIQDIINKNFTGKIKQIPPKYSAIKINGQKALFKAKAGVDFEMKEREVNIKEIEILDFNYPSLIVRAKVSVGTYIRSIAYDLGQIIGTGGYVKTLERTKIGDFTIDMCQNLDTFDSEKSLDENLVFPGNLITLDETILEKINHGLQVSGKFDFEVGKKLFVTDGKTITNVVYFDGNFLIPERKI
nr:tRNA pseudouridine(55) synthase TruB [Candidatus Gracilibacteria bacterium]